MTRLKGLTALVTGAAQGIGEATAARFREEGTEVIATDIQERPGLTCLDVTQADQIADLARLGDQAAIGSYLIIMTIISSAIIPPLMGYLADAVDAQSAYILPLIAYVLVFVSTIAGRERE